MDEIFEKLTGLLIAIAVIAAVVFMVTLIAANIRDQLRPSSIGVDSPTPTPFVSYSVEVQQVSQGMYRLIDTEAGVVCYEVIQTGHLSCLPISETNLER